MNKLEALTNFMRSYIQLLVNDTRAVVNYAKLFRDWGIPIIIIVAAFSILPSYLTPILGPALGAWAGYGISAVVAAIALWLSKQAQKQV